jgi:putative transposase
MGPAIPHRIGRHVHHKARPDDTTLPPTSTGIDYLRLVEAKHTAELAARVRYSHLPDGPLPDQLPLPGISDDNGGQTSAPVGEVAP